MMSLMTAANFVSTYSDNAIKDAVAPPMNFSLYNFWYQNHITISLVMLIIAICISVWNMYEAVQQLNRRSNMYKKRYLQHQRTLLQLRGEFARLNKEATKWHYLYNEMREELDRMKVSFMKLKNETEATTKEDK